MLAPLSRVARVLGVLMAGLAILTLALLCAPQRRVQADVEPRLIRLQQATFDPLQGEPPLPAHLKFDAYDTSVPNYYLLQLRGPVEVGWKEAIE